MEHDAIEMFETIDSDHKGSIGLNESLPAYTNLSKRYGTLVPADYPEIGKQQFGTPGFASPAFSNCEYANIAAGYIRSQAQLLQQGSQGSDTSISLHANILGTISSNTPTDGTIDTHIKQDHMGAEEQSATIPAGEISVIHRTKLTETERCGNSKEYANNSAESLERRGGGECQEELKNNRELQRTGDSDEFEKRTRGLDQT